MASRIEPVDESWRNLGELREWALRKGFTLAQFGYAIDRVGPNPHDIATELQHHLFMAAMREDQSEEE
jgi:hypothetical protein